MKNALLFACLFLGFASAAEARFNIDMGPGSGEMRVKDGGMIVNFGGHKMARRRIGLLPGTLRIGDTVITKGGSTGTLKGINPSTKKLSVQVGYYINSYTIDEVAVTNGCNEVFCVGENVVTAGGSVATVKGFFNDDSVAAQVGYYIHNYSPHQLGIEDACSGMFCTGDTVITSGGSTGTIIGLFSNGNLGVQVGYYINNYEPTDLSVTQAICINIYIDRIGVCQ